MIKTLFFPLLIGFALLYMIIGKRVSSNIKSIDDYFLSKRNLGIFSLALTLLATQLGGGALLGASDEAYVKGWSVLFYPLGMSLGLIALSLGFGAKLRRLNIKTMSEIFQKVYGSKRLQKITATLSIATLFFILVAQGIAARKFFYSIGFDQNIVFLMFWFVVILYTVIGGLRGVVNTDIVQTIFIFLALFLVFFVSKGASSIEAPMLPSSTVTGNIPWIGWLLMPLLFMMIEQDMGQRCFAAKNGKVVSKAGIVAAILLFFSSAFAIYFGVLARKMGLDVSSQKGVLMTAITATTPSFISTIFACAILMVIISTADSLLCSIASNLMFDFSFFKNKNMKSKLIFSQIITFLVGIVAVSCSYFFDNVLFLLIQSYEFSVSVLFVPIAMAIFSKKVSKKAAITSMSVGAFCFIAFRVWTPPFPREMLTLLLAFSGFFFVEKKAKLPVSVVKKVEIEATEE